MEPSDPSHRIKGGGCMKEIQIDQNFLVLSYGP